MQLHNLGGQFQGCVNLESISAGDAPNLSNITNISYMFDGATSLMHADLASWDYTTITNLNHMLDDTGLSITDYSNLLIKWAATVILTDIVYTAPNLQYSSAAASAWDYLVNTLAWIITDAGLDVPKLRITEDSNYRVTDAGLNRRD